MGSLRNLVWVSLLFLLAFNAGCECINPDPLIPETTSSTTTTTEDLGPCGMDCSKIETPQCTVAVCNTGQVVGPINSCVVVSAEDDTSCDDGKFCTVDDVCKGGSCSGGHPNHCGKEENPCEAVVCYEESKSCDSQPVNDGTECKPTDLCEVNGVCELGVCVGEPKDCQFSPLNECNKVSCDPTTGQCVGVPDVEKEDAPCTLTGDVCMVNRTCKAGVCQGGSAKDCSALDVGCHIGICDPLSGACTPRPADVGTVCTEGIHECDVGECDDKGTCAAKPAPNGTTCNDHNACTKTDKCTAGLCGGSSIAGCSLYLHEGFETCPAGWTLAGDWECGTPENVGPTEPHTGTGCIGTQIDALYHVNQSFTGATADSPSIDLKSAVSPQLSFWAWDRTEGGTFDGWNLKISTDGGQNFTAVTTVTPAYPLTILSQPAWGGDHSADGWQYYKADLTAYAGQQDVILRFAFRSDGASVYPGVYIDDVTVAEPQEDPLYLMSEPPLPDVYAEQAYTAQIPRFGGTENAVWTLVGPGVNANWVTLDGSTGILGGTPTAANIGPVTISVHVEEPGLPSNFADATFTFNVKPATYYTSFEGACPNGWTLNGDWQCGVPQNVGPATAYVGTQCIATKIAANYSDLQSYGGATATSPVISLAGAINPKLSFRMWVDTEGSTYDGFNLWISTDNGVNWTLNNDVTPAYPLVVAGKAAWGGHQSALGWQAVEADLSAWAGQDVRVRFAFRSDASGNFPGVYIDDVLLN